MPLSYLHAVLDSKQFPFNFRELSSTVLLNNGWEQNRQIVQGNLGDDWAQNYGICQAFFLQNVLPITRGYSSAHYIKKISATVPGGTAIDRIFILRDSNGNVALFSPAKGQNLIYDPNSSTWSANPVSGFTGSEIGDCTVVYLKGITYICFKYVGLYVYDFSTHALVAQVLVSIDTSAILGVTAANNYLILWTLDTVLWSSPVNPLDFTPGIGVGGSTQVLGVRSPIKFISQIANGILLFTNVNVVAGQYSGNPQFPFNFQEIPNSAGVSTVDDIGYQTTDSGQIAYTSAGMQLLNVSASAQNMYDELSDAISRGLYTTQDNGNFYFPYYATMNSMVVKITEIGSRFQVHSIREETNPEFQFAYVFDKAINRWGRLDIPHADVFQYQSPIIAATDSWDYELGIGSTWNDYMIVPTWEDAISLPVPDTELFGESLGFIKTDGRVYICVLAENTLLAQEGEALDTDAPIANIILGRYKVKRPNAVELHEILIDRLLVGGSLYGYSVDVNGNILYGKQITAKNQMTTGQYFDRITGDAVCVGAQGTFTLTNLTLGLANGGTDYRPQTPITGNGPNFAAGGI